MGHGLISEILEASSSEENLHNYLTHISATLAKYYKADLLICFELIPESGGVPGSQPICIGEFFDKQKSVLTLEEFSHVGNFGNLIQNDIPIYVDNAQAWIKSNSTRSKKDGYIQFLKGEKIKSFIFLPTFDERKLCALILYFRNTTSLSEYQRQQIEICTKVMGTQIARLERQTQSQAIQRSRMATAHTLYNEVAMQFRNDIESLENEIAVSFAELGVEIPPKLSTSIEATKNTVFKVMRNLVIKTSGDLLVNLQSMSLYKALSTASVALTRAWPPDQKVEIAIEHIPPVIERQSLALRQMLYAMILEIMGNSIKHGGPAPYINVELGWHNRYIIVNIIDHGKGFDTEQRPFSETGLGFWSDYIKQHFAGTFEVNSRQGYGTVVLAKIPVIPNRRHI